MLIAYHFVDSIVTRQLHRDNLLKFNMIRSATNLILLQMFIYDRPHITPGQSRVNVMLTRLHLGIGELNPLQPPGVSWRHTGPNVVV